jgi:hypothetical protein
MRCRKARGRAPGPDTLSPPSGLTRQPRSPKGLGHRIAVGRPGIASACTRLGRSQTFLRSRLADFGGCRGRPRFREFDRAALSTRSDGVLVDLQHLDTNDITGIRNLAWVLDVTSGHRRDVHQSVLVDPHILLLKKQGVAPKLLVTDKLRSYAGVCDRPAGMSKGFGPDGSASYEVGS